MLGCDRHSSSLNSVLSLFCTKTGFNNILIRERGFFLLKSPINIIGFMYPTYGPAMPNDTRSFEESLKVSIIVSILSSSYSSIGNVNEFAKTLVFKN